MILRSLFSFLILAAVAWCSQVPYGRTPSHGVLRLSWKTVGEKIRVAVAEQGDVPDHMRVQKDYEEKMRSYRLRAEVDGKVWLDKLMQPPGLHHDRPISVFEELELAPGEHDVVVQFLPEPAEGATWKPEVRKRVAIHRGLIQVISLPTASP